MCGLFGLITKVESKGVLSLSESKWLAQVGLASQIRGLDASGICSINKNAEVTVFKRPDNWSNFQEHELVDDAMNLSGARIFLGHVRKGTMGAKGYNGAQPYHHGDSILMHNGTLSGMMEQYPRAATDSEALCMDIDIRGMKPALEEAWGAFATVLYNTDSGIIRIARNTDRTLYYSWSPGRTTMYYASEIWMLADLLARNNITVISNKDGYNVFKFETDNIYELDVFKEPTKGFDMVSTAADFALTTYEDLYGWKGQPTGGKTKYLTVRPENTLHTPTKTETGNITGDGNDYELLYRVSKIVWAGKNEHGKASEFTGSVFAANGTVYDCCGKAFNDDELKEAGVKCGDVIQAKISMIDDAQGMTAYDIRKPVDQVAAVKSLTDWMSGIRKHAPSKPGTFANVFGRLVPVPDVVDWCGQGCLACTIGVDALATESYKVLDNNVICIDCYEMWHDEIHATDSWEDDEATANVAGGDS